MSGPVSYTRWFTICAFAATTAACAIGIKAGDGPTDLTDAAVAEDAGSTSSSSSSASSSSSTSSSSGGSDAGGEKDTGPVLPTGCTTLMINEVQVAGTSNALDEFVEIYNPNGNPCPLADWKLVYRSQTGTVDVTLYAGTASAPSVPSLGYVVLAGSAFNGASQGDLLNGLAGSGGGQLAIKDDQDNIIDSLGYGSTTGAFVRGSAAPMPGGGKSIARTPNGKDTKNNQADFTVTTNPSPGQAN